MSSKNAFTLIEVLIAASIAAIVIVGSFELLVSGFRQTQTIAAKDELARILYSVRSCILSLGTGGIAPLAGGPWASVNFGSDHLSCLTGSVVSGTGIFLSSSYGSGQTGGTVRYDAVFTVQTGSFANSYDITETVTGPTGSGTLGFRMY